MKIVNLTLNNPFLNFAGEKHYKSQFQMPKPLGADPKYDEFIKSSVDEKDPLLGNIRDKIPKNELGASALQSFQNGEIDYETFLKTCSLVHELCLLNGARSYDINQIETVKALENEFSKGGVNASNYEMAAHLVEESMLHPNTLTFNKVRGELNQQFVSDLDKIFVAKMEGKDLKEVFVPEFKNIDEAKDSLKTGEVCQIKDSENISIKLDNGEVEELFISPRTYLELFPPAQRFALAQGGTGDCFLISAFNSAYLNPASRHLILEMFKENPDGTLNTSIGGYKKEGNKVVLKNSNSYELKDAENKFSKEDISDNFSRYAAQFEGFRVLELTAREGAESGAYKHIKQFYNKFSNSIETLQNDDDYIIYKDRKYTKKEMQAFLDITGDIKDKDVVLQSMVSLKDMFFNIELDKKQVQELLKALKAAKEEFEDEITADVEYFELALERCLDYSERNNEDTIELEFLPYNFFNELVGRDPEEEIDYLNGGTAAAVYHKMGLKTKSLNTSTKRREGEKFLNQILSDRDFNSKYILGVASFNNDKSKIIQAHEYSMKQLEQVEEDGKIMYAFTNPHNGAKEAILTPHQVKKAFSDFEFAYIK